jgi:hypothetical protein
MSHQTTQARHLEALKEEKRQRQGVLGAIDRLSEALDRNLTSPNVENANFGPANVVDALDRIGTALFAIADALSKDS